MTPQELEKKVSMLIDVEEIKKLQREYLYLMTDARFDELAPLFTKNATIKIGDDRVVKGKAAILKLFKEDSVMTGGHKGGHNLIHPVITIQTNTAQGYWAMFRFFYDYSQPENPRLRWQQGKYECEYVKEDGKWLLSLLKYTVPWPVQP
jgi:hypothetical protein